MGAPNPSRHVGSVVPGCPSQARMRQLQEVMGQTHQAPLLRHMGESAQQHLPKPSCLFDLPEDRFHCLFAQSASTPIAASSELDLQGPWTSPELCVTDSCRRGMSVVMPTSGHVALDMPPLQFPEIGFRAVAGIGRYLSRLPAADVRLDLATRGASCCWSLGPGHLLGDDNLTGGIDGSLRVVSLHDPSEVVIIRLSRSVKLRWARSAGAPDGRVRDRSRVGGVGRELVGGVVSALARASPNRGRVSPNRGRVLYYNIAWPCPTGNTTFSKVRSIEAGLKDTRPSLS
jgi:hypothetical protein